MVATPEPEGPPKRNDDSTTVRPAPVGLPPIEEYTSDYPDTGVADREREMSAREILFDFVLNNRMLWILALANVFV